MVRLVLFTIVLMIAAEQTLCAQAYDPLETIREASSPKDLTISDPSRSREIPVRIYRPSSTEPAPVILLSHGLGGSVRACGYLGKHWSERGYAVVAMQHAGSDELVWKDLPRHERMSALKQAISIQNTIARYQDVAAVLHQLETWNQSQDHAFYNHFDLQHIGMSGHSYGASTTQGVSGQSAPFIGQRYTDQRIDAAIMLSPNRSKRVDPHASFGKVAIPWLLMTGTKDTSPISDTKVSDRRQVYPALPNSVDKYELVLFEAEHSAFGDNQQGNHNPNHHRVIQALSTAFWDAHLRQNEPAKKWLHGAGPRSMMQSKDEWQLNTAAPKAD